MKGINSQTYAQGVGQSVRRLCGMYGLTNEALAKEVGVSPQTLSSIVMGRHEARSSNYRRIFDFFGLNRPIDDFAGSIDEILAVFDEVELRASRVRGER